ncbi:MAG: hypothetical protein EOP81_07970 [Variovorax sp.]|nr:MAG: hypothetical protein EOP81_07970 [Variovorax sp.]
MTSITDMAVTVEEQGDGAFVWKLIAATNTEASDALHYRIVQTASAPQASYMSALALGVSAMRRIAATRRAGGPSSRF